MLGEEEDEDEEKMGKSCGTFSLRKNVGGGSRAKRKISAPYLAVSSGISIATTSPVTSEVYSLLSITLMLIAGHCSQVIVALCTHLLQIVTEIGVDKVGMICAGRAACARQEGITVPPQFSPLLKDVEATGSSYLSVASTSR